MNNNNVDLKKAAFAVRQSVLKQAFTAQSAHTGGSLSVVEILTTLYFRVMHIDPKHPDDPKRDRLIFSKAHDCKALYAVLAERGYFPKKLLERYEQDGGLPGHSTKGVVPGSEITGGSLGHGLSIAAGMALAAKLEKKKHRIFAILSDGECDEGSTWEAILFAGHHHLDNLIAVVDYNKLQAYGRTTDILDLEPFVNKWQSFGWSVKESDGHDTHALTQVLVHLPFQKYTPSILIAHTIKGFGGAFQHVDKVSSQYKPPTEQEIRELVSEESL